MIEQKRTHRVGDATRHLHPGAAAPQLQDDGPHPRLATRHRRPVRCLDGARLPGCRASARGDQHAWLAGADPPAHHHRGHRRGQRQAPCRCRLRPPAGTLAGAAGRGGGQAGGGRFRAADAPAYRSCRLEHPPGGRALGAHLSERTLHRAASRTGPPGGAGRGARPGYPQDGLLFRQRAAGDQGRPGLLRRAGRRRAGRRLRIPPDAGPQRRAYVDRPGIRRRLRVLCRRRDAPSNPGLLPAMEFGVQRLAATRPGVA